MDYLEWPTDLLESFVKEEDVLTMFNDKGERLLSPEVELALGKLIVEYVGHNPNERYVYRSAL